MDDIKVTFYGKTFTVGKKYRIDTWREDYFIEIVLDCKHDEVKMESGKFALMSGWKSVIDQFKEI